MKTDPMQKERASGKSYPVFFREDFPIDEEFPYHNALLKDRKGRKDREGFHNFYY